MSEHRIEGGAFLFSGPDYYPRGGWLDFIGAYPTDQTAMDACKPYDGYDWAWAHVVVDGVIAWERVGCGGWVKTANSPATPTR